MIFPLSVSFNKRLKATITSDNQQKILQYIAKSILHDQARNVIVEDIQVTYKGSTSYGRGSLFGSIDKGTFNLVYNDNSWWLNYRINMPKLFIATSILSSFMGVFSLVNAGPWWIGIAAFMWLCGTNWVIILIRHDSLAADIVMGIDELICGKTELPEEDRMTGKLKSWF